MEKAVLVIDIPTECDECRFHYETYDENDYYVDKCELLNDMTIDGYTKKYDGCPLKSVNKIVERLEELKDSYVDAYAKTSSSYCRGCYGAYDDAIAIVKAELN